jgi:hypothetical protein
VGLNGLQVWGGSGAGGLCLGESDDDLKRIRVEDMAWACVRSCGSSRCLILESDWISKCKFMTL